MSLFLSFIHLAEESSRPAFQSIESLVHAVSSVSMMLESTFHALYSSFRAVLSVADHFSRLKMHFTQIFSAFAVIRTLKWIYKKLLYALGKNVGAFQAVRSMAILKLIYFIYLGFSPEDPITESAWTDAMNTARQKVEELQADPLKGRSSWPIVIFFGIVMSGPYLLWRLLSSMTGIYSTEKRSN